MGVIKGIITGHWNGLPWYEVRPEIAASDDCPTCGRTVKTYCRRLSVTMARGLVRLYRAHKANPRARGFHVGEIDAQRTGGEFAQLRFWGLMSECSNDSPNKRTSGLWSIMECGAAFAERRTRVPAYILLGQRSALVGYAGPMVDVRECLEASNKFSYEDLMGADYGKGTQLLLDRVMGPKNV